tara:strand:+ start:788 stop:1669 length:882 start_codon:yes stop_codon:yes gene_type:complete
MKSSKNIKKIIAITGSTGVLGKKFIQQYKNFTYKKIDFDITNEAKLSQWIKNEKFDAFLHFAAIVPINIVKKNKKKAKEVNYISTKNIVDLLLKYKNSKNFFFFYASSSHVYKPLQKKRINEMSEIKPINFYGTTKYLSELYIVKKLDKSKIKYSIGRIFSFTDREQNDSYFIPSIFKKFFKKKSFYSFYGLNKYRDFVSTNDIVKAINILLRKKKNGIFNIGSGKKYLLKEIVLLIQKKYFNKKLIKFHKMFRGSDLVSDITKIKKLGWKPKDDIYNILDKYYKKNEKKILL